MDMTGLPEMWVSKRDTFEEMMEKLKIDFPGKNPEISICIVSLI